ncbi:Nucleolar protein 9 [Tulasnella sp. JGI-2019a]|nr:Nucleolar protein 9 [Tulasnella sp. JGI-2019a]
MPKEPRKRARKHRPEVVHDADDGEAAGAGPSWIVQSNEPQSTEEPLDPDLKAYFRSVDIKLQEWASEDSEQVILITDQLEDRHAFILAAISEIRGHEIELSEDPECSKIIEKIIRSLDDALLRSFFSNLLKHLPTLIKHRFGSHVCQTLLTSSAATLNREMQGITSGTSGEHQDSTTPSMKALILQVSESLLGDSLPLMSDASASPVIRTLLALLSTQSWIDILPQKRDSTGHPHTGKNRKPTHDRYQQRGIVTGKPLAAINANTPVPPEFILTAKRYLEHICSEATAEAMRDAVYDEVTSPALQVLVKLEAQQSSSNQSESLLDFILPGVVSGEKDVINEHSDHLDQIFRHPVGSHFIEAVVANASEQVFRQLWNRLIRRNMASLINDPVANFVIASAFGKVNEKGLEDVMPLPSTVWSECVESGRTGVIQALIRRSAELHSHEAEVVDIVCSAFGVQKDDDRRLIVPCVTTLTTIKTYREPPSTTPNMYGPRHGGKSRPRTKEPSIQGALVLQSLLRLDAPHNSIVLRSIEALTQEETLALAQSPVNSRILDVLLESPTVPYRSKRALVMTFIGCYQTLVDDRIGNFVGEKLWQAADPYLREKIANSLVEHEDALVASRYGKYFIKNANMWLLKKDPIKWRKKQAEKGHQNHSTREGSTSQPQTKDGSASMAEPAKDTEEKREKRKREEQAADEIDGIFSTVKKKGKRPLV